VVYARSKGEVSSECSIRVVSRKAEGGGSRGRGEETRCSELKDYLAGMHVGCGYACEAARRWPTNPAAMIGAAIGLPFACCFWQLFPAAGGRRLSEGQVFRSRGLDCRVTINSHGRDAVSLVDYSVAGLLTHEYLDVICVAELTPPRCNEDSISPPTAYCPRAPLPAHPSPLSITK
jgi:hypothetical protein